MDSKFHGLPPLKRFIFMQQEEQQQDRDTAVSSSRLPAKKRKESRDPPLFFHEPIATTGVVTTYGLPAKKRVSISMSNSSKVWVSRKLEIEAKKKGGGDVDDDGIVKSPLLVAYVRPKPSFSSQILSKVRSSHSLLKDKSSTASKSERTHNIFSKRRPEGD